MPLRFARATSSQTTISIRPEKTETMIWKFSVACSSAAVACGWLTFSAARPRRIVITLRIRPIPVSAAPAYISHMAILIDRGGAGRTGSASSPAVLAWDVLAWGVLAWDVLVRGVLVGDVLVRGVLVRGVLVRDVLPAGVLARGVLAAGVLAAGVLAAGVLAVGGLAPEVLAAGGLVADVLPAGCLESGRLGRSVMNSSLADH